MSVSNVPRGTSGFRERMSLSRGVLTDLLKIKAMQQLIYRVSILIDPCRKHRKSYKICFVGGERDSAP